MSCKFLALEIVLGGLVDLFTFSEGGFIEIAEVAIWLVLLVELDGIDFFLKQLLFACLLLLSVLLHY
jgi:hypothetical protein